MNTTSLGRQAEQAVADELQQKGYRVVERNWKRRLCEIDIVAEKDNVVYLAEVKYRSRPAQGDGFEHITGKKLKQLRLAARVWAKENDWDGDLRLLAAAVHSVAGALVVEDILELDF